MKSILPETVLSSIESGATPSQPKCDVYKTSVEENDDYRLIPVNSDALPYYNTAGALLTKKAFEDKPLPKDYSQEEMALCSEESGRFVEIVTRMEQKLQAFLKNGDIEMVRDFEKGKDEVASFSGIGCFWAALLNLKLNSIPMLDGIKGARMSAEACAAVIKQIQKAISHH